jgi:hypothetical protein
LAVCGRALSTFTNNFRSLPAVSIERLWNNGSNVSAIIAAVKLATFFENIGQMGPALIPNNYEHEFFD